MRNWITIFWMFLLPLVSHAQENVDSVTVFRFDMFYQMVLTNHPVVKQANLLSEKALQEIRLARGAFDPKLEGAWEMKQFNDTEYYNLLDVSLKIPVWFPVNPKVGIEQNRGTFLNPENYISEGADNRQIYWGVNIPVGQGLFIDERRAVVKKALVLQEMAEADRIKEINKVLLYAAKDYWEWYKAFSTYELMQQNIRVAEDIFSRTRLAFDYGEVAAIDTVQAGIALMNRISERNQARIDFIRTSLRLSNHLWDPEGIPLELNPDLVPENPMISNLDSDILEQLLRMARENHPDLQKIRLRDQTLEVDEQLARENLKPRLDVGYYLLDQPWNSQGNRAELRLDKDYKIGINMAFPLFLRKERAKLGMVRLKRTEVALQDDFTTLNIINEINIQYQTLVNLVDVIRQQELIVQNYQLLVNAEQLNLQNGESDLFKINIQLEKLIEAQEKLIKSRAVYQKELATLFWAAGQSQRSF